MIEIREASTYNHADPAFAPGRQQSGPLHAFPKSFDVSRFSGTVGGGRPGPKTPQGKAIAARNATTHGLFARNVVLPSLGEDPKGYETLYYSLCEQLEPGNLIEHHYIEAIAEASWRLRGFHCWQAQIYENEALTEDERLDKLDRVLRHETALHRQIDKSVRLLGRDVPTLFEGRARKEALVHLGQTERGCRSDLNAAQDVADRAHDNLQFISLPTGYDRTQFDNTQLDNLGPAPDAPSSEAPACEASNADAPAEIEKCQNELLPLSEEDEEKDGEEARQKEVILQKEAVRKQDAALEAAHPLKPRQKSGRLKQVGSKKRSSTLPLLSSVLLPLKKAGKAS